MRTRFKSARVESSCLTYRLDSNLSPEFISAKLGVPFNQFEDDESKVTYNWQFKDEDGNEFSIWDYKGSRWSVYDPKLLLTEIFNV